jgi:hypothetical protein
MRDNTSPSGNASLVLYNGIASVDVDIVKEALEKGASPDYCIGDAGWYDSDPIDVLVESIFDTYYEKPNRKTAQENLPDRQILRLLLDAGADITKRPYVWHGVVMWDNETIEQIKKTADSYGHERTAEEIQKHINAYIMDANRLLEGLLINGADPDKLGHGYPYTLEAIHQKITDEQANEYFVNGTRAINEAIKKGIVWESQIDLLLQYTKLDEETLNAAQESNDPLMVDKISRLWELQNK